MDGIIISKILYFSINTEEVYFQICQYYNIELYEQSFSLLVQYFEIIDLTNSNSSVYIVIRIIGFLISMILKCWLKTAKLYF